MRYIILLIAGLIINTNALAQKDDARQIKSLGESIIEHKTSYADDLKELIDCTDLFDSNIEEEELLYSLERLRDFKALNIVRDSLETFIKRFNHEDSLYQDDVFYHGLVNNLKTLDQYINRRMAEQYSLYAYTQTSDKYFKSFHIYHDNDVFMFSSKNNDRDYTGGFRLEMTTDKLKFRAFNKLGIGKILTYQSLLFGGEGYTPYIRFTIEEMAGFGIDMVPDTETGFLKSESLTEIKKIMFERQQKSDRPFASFQYIGRGKYRMYYSGKIKSNSYFKIGFIGKNLGENIQSILHQDFTHDSQRVLNWDKQIANGGRLAFNIEHKFYFMLLSQAPTIFKSGGSPKIPDALNIYLPVELQIGTVNTNVVPLGFGITNINFLKSSGHGDVIYRKNYHSNFFHRVWAHTNLFFEYRLRYVQHNTILEGFGIFETWEDDVLDDEAVTVHKLDSEDVTRWLHEISLGATIRFRNFSVTYSQHRYLNKEFEIKGLESETPGFSTQNGYGYGRIGFNLFF